MPNEKMKKFSFNNEEFLKISDNYLLLNRVVKHPTEEQSLLILDSQVNTVEQLLEYHGILVLEKTDFLLEN